MVVGSLNLQHAIHMCLLSRMIYSERNSRTSQHSWSPSAQTAKQWKQSCSFVTKTYGTDQEECVSVLNHSDKPNEFARSTEWVFVLFSERGLEFLSKSLQQWWVRKWSASFEMKGRGGLLSTHLPVGETNANHLLSYRLAIQHLAEKEPVSDAAVCYSS